MKKTFKEYNKENEFLFDAVGFSKFIKEVKTLKRSLSYNEPNKEITVSQKPHGYITLKSIFTRSNFSGYGMPIDNVKNFAVDYADWLVLDEQRNNTCNISAPVESNLEYDVLTLKNPVNNRLVDAVLFSFCTSLDVRGSYSSDCIILFDNESKNHYELSCFLGNYYKMANGSFNIDNKEFSFSVEGCLNDDALNIYINNKDNIDIESMISAPDFYDQTQFKDDLKELLNDSYNFKDAKIKGFRVAYMSQFEN